MALSISQVITGIRHAASMNDQSALKKSIVEASHVSGRKDRKDIINAINRVVIEIAIEKNNCDILFAIKGISHDTIPALFLPVIQHYTRTQDQSLLQVLLKIGQIQERKSNQFQILSLLTQKMIEAGIANSDPVLISRGIKTLDLVNFRKYRSELLIQIIPHLIVWGFKIKDIDLLDTVYSLILEISDASQRSILHARLAGTIGALAIEKNDVASLGRSLHIACEIKQKNRRQNSIGSIIGSAAKTSLSNSLFNLPSFLLPFLDVSKDLQLEISDAVLWQLLSYENDREHLLYILQDIAEKTPDAHKTIIQNLLKKTQDSGDIFFLDNAIRFHDTFSRQRPIPIRELVKAGISVAEHTGDITALTSVVPIIEQSCDEQESARFFIQIALIMASRDHFTEALQVFSKVGEAGESHLSFDACCVLLFKKGIISDDVSLLQNVLSHKLERKRYSDNISHAILDICKNFSYQDITSHIDAINSLILIHPHSNQLLSDSISALINRGFLDEMDPKALIMLSDSISVQSLKEKSLSKIVTKIAKIGVKNKNRDFLQRSVGLTCLIEEEKTRSATLTSIIDDATMLAVLEGDLDLLHRMREWSASLLSKDGEIIAMSNIINGLIKYAIDKHYPEALEEAYSIAQDIHDPSLKKDLIEHIFECFVKIGCLLIEEHQKLHQPNATISALPPFKRGLELLFLHWKKEVRSLKIANLIDIVLQSSRQNFSENYFIPLALFALEIENPDERDAMVLRIVTTINTGTLYSDSTDPYEIFVHYLQSIEFLQNEPVLLDLVFRSVKQIKDPFNRLSKLSDLAESYSSLDPPERTTEILDTILSSLDDLPFIFQRVLLLSDVTYLFSRIDADKSRKSLRMAVHLLKGVEHERESYVRKQVVVAMGRLYEKTQEPPLVDEALDIISGIRDPVEYINAMLLVYRMAKDRAVHHKEIIRKITERCNTIASPAQRASMLLDIAMIINDGGDTFSHSLLKDAENLARSIKISSIADIIRERIAKAYMVIANKSNYNNLVKKAIRNINEIENEETKKNCLDQIGHRQTQDYEPLYSKIRATAQKMGDDGTGTGHIAVMENQIRLHHDRRKRVQYFCNISVVFKNRGKLKIAAKMLHLATDEAQIIRPLSQRAYVLCDMAMVLYAAGCEKKAQNIIDDAFDAATKIRQFQERERVFDNLAFALKFIRQG
jgi:hypothetical protein